MRYLPLTPVDRAAMLDAIGVSSIDALFADVPVPAQRSSPVDLPTHRGEIEVERTLAAMAGRNLPMSAAPSFLGAGAYRHHIPATVDHLIQRGEFLTAYTPYQPEIAQGTLQYLYEFQTQVALLTGMEVANASMYDGSTACVEAIQMACRLTRRARAVLSGGLHPHYRVLAETYARFGGMTVVSAPPDIQGCEDLEPLLDETVACVVVQTPSLFGALYDLRQLAETAHARGILLIAVVTEIISVGSLVSPGDMGADIVVAEGQSLGNGLNFGGPYVGLFATRERLVRQMPGRLVGETRDAAGQRGWVLTLATREQHIRREKATSNICTNAGLCALAFTIHLSLLGEEGLRRLSALNHANACQLADRLARIPGVEVVNKSFFNEFTLRLPRPAAEIVERCAAGTPPVLAGVPVSRLYPDTPALANLLLVAATELTTQADMTALVTALQAI